ncbi:carbon-nitrogen hydrolase family protein [Amycolatopsis sp. lyj-112]|uniref:carbon-nitrogen hydrolase family protein n=1 Tax=Amycolatopsis sp. lyj-112 TaxID=2789288 RepID=UPI00397A310F
MLETVIAALQIGPSSEGTQATLQHILDHEAEIVAAQAKLVVLPEAILGGYPKGKVAGDRFVQYFTEAVDVPGPEVEALAGLSQRTGATLVVGVIERSGSTLYCTALVLDPENGLVGKHRKLVPTARERLVWGRGDGSTMPVVETAAGRAGAVICWENYMPLLRAAMYAKGVELWCAPTVDDSETWQASMRHIAAEGRCFVISACLFEQADQTDDPIAGGSVIVGPDGMPLAGPLTGTEGLLTASIDLADLVAGRAQLDVSGHYARPDIFTLSVDESPRPGVAFL